MVDYLKVFHGVTTIVKGYFESFRVIMDCLTHV